MDSALFGGRYEIRELLGSGGMARVHLAYDTRLGRTVAVKTLLPELARDAEARRRFAREARAAAGLNHPGIVTVHDQDEVRTDDDDDDIVPYLVMEYVDGSTLADLARSQVRLDIERAVRITCDILDALAHAHARGLVHRDVKPSNVLITSTGSIKVADFGIARVVHSLTRITGTGSALGTPGYMSPEQIEDREVDARSDLYAVGCMLTELLTGTVPFPGPTPLTVMYAHVHSTPEPPSARNAAVPPELDAVVIAALSKNPALRPRSAAAMRDDLNGWLAAPRSAATPAPPAVPAPAPAPRPVMPLHPAYNPPHTPPHTPPHAPVPQFLPPVSQRPGEAYTAPRWGAAPVDPRRGKARRIALVAVAAAVVLTAGTLVAVRLGSSSHPPAHTVTALDLVDERHPGTGFNGAVTGTVNPSTVKGGTLKLMSFYAPDSLDPARSYSPLAWNLDRLLLRKLVDFAPQPGQEGAALAPDLATTTGAVSDDGRTYTYTLKKGVTFEDGTAITSKDIKYGIERTFATDLFSGGPTHLRDLLDQGQSYPGPYKDTSPDQLGLKSVLTPDDRTIVFHLDAPFADFPYVLALPMSSPVPQAKDTKDNYEKQPVASGPYKIAFYDRDKKLRLVRNEKWDPATDGIRTALPDVVDFTVAASSDAVDAALLSGEADLDPGQAGVQDATRTKILASDSLKANADSALVGAVRYLSLQTAVAPLNDYRCRWAVQYAANRTALRDAGGGKDAGDVAGGMLPPTVGGYDPHLNTYGTTSGRAYPDLAKRQLTDCGHASGFSTKIVAAAGNPRTKAVAESLRTQLAAVGITARTEYPEAADLYATLPDQKKLKERGWGIILTTWQADWPTPAGFLRPLLLTGSPSNYAALADQQLKDLMDEADAKTDRNSADSVWRTVDSTSQDRGTLIPFMYVRELNYRSARLTNVYLHPALGGVDLQALGVKG